MLAENIIKFAHILVQQTIYKISPKKTYWIYSQLLFDINIIVFDDIVFDMITKILYVNIIISKLNNVISSCKKMRLCERNTITIIQYIIRVRRQLNNLGVIMINSKCHSFFFQMIVKIMGQIIISSNFIILLQFILYYRFLSKDMHL